MNTTIQVDISTKEALDLVKRAYHAKSYDDAIRRLFAVKSKSMSGDLADGKKHSMAKILSGLREKDDRI